MYVQNNRVTDVGLAKMKQQMPHIDFSKVESDPNIEKMGGLITVNSVVTYVDRKLNGTAASA